MKNKLVAIVLLLVGIGLEIIFGLQLLTSGAIKKGIEHNREHLKSFQVASSRVDVFIKANQRLPNNEEFKFIDEFITINSSASDYPKEWERAPQGSYYLARWTGDNDEFYAAWNQKTTLQFDEDAYYLFHSKALTWLLTIVGIAFILAGIQLFRLSKR